MTIITPTGITGITSITSTGNTLQFQNSSGADVSVSGLNVTSGTNINVSGIVTASGGFSGNINSSGVSTFTNGPVLIGTGTSTGTASQRLQVTGGAYVSGNLGVGITAPKGAIHLVDSTYKCLVLSNTNNNSTSSGGVIAGERYTKTNNPFVAFASWDGAGTVRKAYVGGGGWNLPEATEIGLYTAATYDETSNAALERLQIDSSGRVTMRFQPAFQTVGTNYSQSGAAYSIIIPNVVSHNQGSHYNGSTGRFTAPVAGRYLFGFWGLSYPHNTEVNQIRGFVNGSATGQEVQFGGAAHQHINHSGSILLNLNANDIFDFRYYQASGSAKAYSSQWNMWGYLIG
jgi:hypothetical protein